MRGAIEIKHKDVLCWIKLQHQQQNARVIEISLEKLNSDRAADHKQEQKKDQNVKHWRQWVQDGSYQTGHARHVINGSQWAQNSDHSDGWYVWVYQCKAHQTQGDYQKIKLNQVIKRSYYVPVVTHVTMRLHHKSHRDNFYDQFSGKYHDENYVHNA